MAPHATTKAHGSWVREMTGNADPDKFVQVGSNSRCINHTNFLSGGWTCFFASHRSASFNQVPRLGEALASSGVQNIVHFVCKDAGAPSLRFVCAFDREHRSGKRGLAPTQILLVGILYENAVLTPASRYSIHSETLLRNG